MIKKFRWLLIATMILMSGYIILDATWLSVNRLKVRELVISDSRIPLALDDASILVFSDSYGNEKQLKKVLKIVEDNQPDFIIFLGNLLSESPQETEIIQNTLKLMDAPLGKYAILGENDYLKDTEIIEKILLESDFRIVKNKLLPMHRFSDDYILFSFLDQNYEGYQDTLLLSKDVDQFTLMFHHSPSIVTKLEGTHNILIAGETQRGKVNIPLFGSIYFKDNYIEAHQKVNNTDLYLTSGIGTSDPGFRFMADPDVLYITLKSSQ